ncbi:MAG TPA: AraC family transcriptional regulator [Trebonia sp.]|nr:AraC family transcriptional regulator [Trebonia sp.]
MDRISLHVTEPDEAEEECGRVYYPHRLTVLHERGRFAMSLSALRLGPVAAGLLGYAGEVRLETEELETGYEINVPLSGRLLSQTGTAEVCATAGTAALYRPDDRSRLQGWADGGKLFGLKIERAVLEARLAELTSTPVRSVIPLGPRLDLRAGAGQRWWELAQVLAGFTADPAGPLNQPMVMRPLVESVLTALLYAADHPYRAVLAARCSRPGPAAVQRAVDLLEAEPELPWTVGDLACQVGLSTRALQYGFTAHTGLSPMSYLRQVRLQRADADLRAADATGQGVAGIASRWGFTHLGRFAAAYRARYGRTPSQTLHGAR